MAESRVSGMIDAPPDVACERKHYVERIICPAYYVPTEVATVLCVDSRRPARRSVRTEALRGDNNSSCILRANGSCDGTLRG